MKSAVQPRALLVCLVLVAGFSVLSARLVYLQWFDRDLFVREAERSRTQKQTLPASFGLIVDRNGEIMARNSPVTTIRADKVHLRDANVAAMGVAYAELSGEEEWIHGTDRERKSLLRRRARRLHEERPAAELAERYMEGLLPVLSRVTQLSKSELKEKLVDSELQEITIMKDVREDVADRIEEVLRKNHIHGFRFEKDIRRWYTASKLATHTTGFVNHLGKGQCGIERELSQFLGGKDGYRVWKKDQAGLVLLTGGGTLKPPVSGFNVQTSLDLFIQGIVEEELDRGLREFESRQGAVIIMEPKTGDILAIASRPHFDLNLREGFQDAHFHYAVEGLYEPGSTFKIVAAGGALDAGVVSLSTPIDCGWGKVHVVGSKFVLDHHSYGTLSVSDVLMKSSNTGAYRLALKLGRTRFVDYLERFGFKERTGILLKGEPMPMLANPENVMDFSRMSYGYSVAVTPLQVCSAYVAVANGGVLMRPRLVQAVVANDGTVVEGFPPHEVRRVIRESTARKLRTALTTVVTDKGTARLAKVPGFKVFGKTGTADKLRPDGSGFYKDRNVVSFAGALPAENPAFVCVVVIDDPKTNKVKRYGGTIAAPIFSRIAARTAAYMNLTPTEPIEEETLAKTGR